MVDTFIDMAVHALVPVLSGTHSTYMLRTTYRMSDHIVSFWTQFRGDKNDFTLGTFSAVSFCLVTTSV